jgi:hypothetical protein
MSTLNVEKKNAQTAWSEASPEGKKLLENLLGRENFKIGKVTDRIKTVEDAWQEVTGSPIPALPYPNDKNDFEKGLNATANLFVIRAALNEGWIADWSNRNEYKYWPYFEYSKGVSGFGFSDTCCDLGHSYTSVGSRLCYKSRELAEYAGKQFIEVYNQFLLINQ